MPSCPRNYPFYNWVPKPIGIIILLFFFLPILSVGGVYSVNSTDRYILLISPSITPPSYFSLPR